MNRRLFWQSLIFVLLMLPQCAIGFPGPDSGPGMETSCWFSTTTVADDGKTSIEQLEINGPPEPPAGFQRSMAAPPEPGSDRAIIVLPVPAYNWCFGSAPTAAAMIAAWYDRIAYPNIYVGPTNDGVMPMDNTVWPDWVDNHGDTRHQCPLSASRNGLDGRVINGHVDDFWEYLNQGGPDPYEGNWPEHIDRDCTADFMRSNRWMPWRDINVDGATKFYFYPGGRALHDYQLAGYPARYFDGGYGLKMFYESRGYSVTTMYNQYIMGHNENTQGFTYADYMAEIDAGRPVMIHLTGHTMVGVGYDNNSGEVMYVNDCWDTVTNTMVWGGSYAGMNHAGVTIVQIELATLVELISFTANSGPGSIILEWETASELDNAGFNLWRCAAENGLYKKINKHLIPAEGGASWGATYKVTDDQVESGQTYYYKLEDVNFAGDSTLHGPVSARVRPMGGASGQS